MSRRSGTFDPGDLDPRNLERVFDPTIEKNKVKDGFWRLLKERAEFRSAISDADEGKVKRMLNSSGIGIFITDVTITRLRTIIRVTLDFLGLDIMIHVDPDDVDVQGSPTITH